MVLRNSAQKEFAWIRHGKWVRVIAIAIERTQIHFLIDVFVALAVVVLKRLVYRIEEASAKRAWLVTKRKGLFKRKVFAFPLSFARIERETSGYEAAQSPSLKKHFADDSAGHPVIPTAWQGGGERGAKTGLTVDLQQRWQYKHLDCTLFCVNLSCF